ncbi:hypothetical protein [Microbacterium protaetiae]|nr:hypothetical protein [Microbacterium protaetiae]
MTRVPLGTPARLDGDIGTFAAFAILSPSGGWALPPQLDRRPRFT